LAGPPNHPRQPAQDIGGLNHACGAAVDSVGNVYASSVGEDKIKIFDPDHVLIASIADANEPCGLAVDSRGALLVVEQGTGNVARFVPDAYPLTATPTYTVTDPVDASGEATGVFIDPADDALFIAKGDRIEVYRSEVQELRIEGATGGSFTLGFAGQTTTALPYNASAAEVEEALEDLSTVGAGGISVSAGGGGIYRIAFAKALGFTDFGPVVVTSSLTPAAATARTIANTSGGLGVDEAQLINIAETATGGSFKLKFEGEETGAIAYGAPATKSEGAGSVEAALEGLASIAPGDVFVAPVPSLDLRYAVTFEGAYAAEDVAQLEVITALLPNEVQKITVDATAGAYTLTATTATGNGTTTLGSKNVTGVTASFGAFHAGDAIAGPGIPLGATIAAVGAGMIELSANATASGVGTVLNATESTATIAFNAFANTGEGAGSVEAALEDLAGIDTGDVSVTGGPGGSGGTNPYLVTFEGAYGGRNVAQMVRKLSGLTGTATVATTVQGASISASTSTQGWNGRIGEGALGEIAGVGAYKYIGTASSGAWYYVFAIDAETDQVKVFSGESLRALKLRKTIGAVDQDRNPETAEQSLDFGPAGTSVGVDPTSGHFLVFDAASSAVDEFEATGEFLDQIGDPAFDDAEPAALAVHPQWSEVQKIKVSANGGSLKLGFEGAETGEITVLSEFAAAARGVQEALEQLSTIGNGSVFVRGEQEFTGGGRFVVGFRGDLGNRDVEQLTADGSGLTGGANTVTVETSKQGLGPGLIYVSAGAGPGAELLAFGPLVTPSRPLLPELSRELTGAQSVATDSFGNVYVGSGTKVHVYSPTGEELTEVPTPEANPHGVAVDSEGNLYVLEGSNPEQLMTYYTPAVYPPTVGTAYVRHEPVLIPPTRNLGVVAVNPANDHVFVAEDEPNVRLHEFDSVKAGSTVLTSKFGGGLAGNSRSGLGVYKNDGSVYLGLVGGRVARINSSGSEVLGTIATSGDPSRPGVTNDGVAVDQSNGHSLVFEARSNAQEYESSGAFVAEISEVTNPGPGDGIAIDNACALHDPPLTEATSPTCAEFDPANGNVYIAHDDVNDAEFPYDLTVYGPLTYGEAPFAATGVANAIGPAAATLNGTVDPRGFELDECAFEYLTDEEYEQNLEEDDPAFAGASSMGCAESPASIGNGGEPVAVHAVIGGVSPQSTRYRFRLVARSDFGEGAGDAGLLGPPLLTTESALPIGYDEATLRARVDPSGLATTYRFEYGLEEGEYTQSTPEAELAPGDGPVAIEVPVTGLAEGTEYHFRVVVENEAKTVEGPDQTLVTLKRAQAQQCANAEYRTGLSTYLPDCRAYELVTPAETRGLTPGAFTKTGSGEGFFDSWFVTPRGPGAGESLAYGIAGLPGFNGTGRGDSFRAQRGAGAHPAEGWASELFGFSFAQAGGTPPDRHGISPDLGYWLLDVRGIETPVDETLPLGHYLRVPSGLAEPGCSPDPALDFELLGCASLGSDPAAQGRYVSAGGTHVVFASKAHLEDEAAPVGTAAIYDRAAGEASAEVVSVKPDGSSFATGEHATYVAATEDGSAVVFEVGSALYLHRDGQTTQIAAGLNTFDGISADGKRVFYMDATLAQATPPPPANLYACDTETGPCAGPGAHAPTQIASNSIFVNISADGSRAFFTSEDALSGPAEENSNGEHAEAGEHNLYSWDGSDVSFIAILDPEDLVGFGEETEETLTAWTRAIPGQGIGRAFSPTRSTLRGEFLIFQSHARLTAYDNEGHSEIYHTTPDGQIECASCDPSGAPAGAEAMFQSYQPAGVVNPTSLIPNLTDDGQRVFFQTSGRLLPEDANSAIDVYEWKAQGAGDCVRAGGCLALISSGQGESPNYLFAMTADGSDVFFQTPEKLVGADIPGSPSIYDARVEGGIPNPPVAAPCQGDACQGQGSTPPALPAPASTGAGEGNVSEAGGNTRCAKGKRRVKGRCVKKAKKQKNQHKKSGKRSHRQANHNRGASR